MTKNLLTLAAVSVLAVSANALDLPLDDLASGWNSSYDAATQTITYEGAWSGRGWWFGEADYSAYDKVVIEIEPATITAQVNVEYVGEGSTISSSGLCEIGATTISVPLNPQYKDAVMQMYIQCGTLTANPTITIKSAQLVSNDGDNSALWEGSYTASGWNAGVQIAAYQVKVGDILHYHMTPGNDNAQLIIKGADWSNLPGATKITNNAIIDGIVEVVVTDQMLDNCGGQFFLQGDGGLTCTQVEVAGHMEPMNDAYVLNYGKRHLFVQAFTTISEGYKYLALAFDAQPTWLQVCNSGWTTLVDNESATVIESDDAVYMVFELNDAIISGINGNAEMILNGDDAVIYYGALLLNELPSEGGSEGPLYTVGAEDNATPWWSAWSPTAVLTGDGTIHFEFVNYSDEVNNWDNWLAVLVNGDFNPAVEGYGIDNELLVIRADNYGWGPLYGNTVLTNDYNWDTFKQDMNGSKVSLDITRSGQEVLLEATITTAAGEIYAYTAKATGVVSESLGVFLTVEGGHLDVYDVKVTETSSIKDMIQDAAAARYYNINGIEMTGSTLPAGLYIVKQGDKTSKVIIR